MPAALAIEWDKTMASVAFRVGHELLRFNHQSTIRNHQFMKKTR
jgi:hypothetical protein